MRSVFFGFVVFLIWAVFARYYYVCVIKDHCSATPVMEKVDTRPNTLTLSYGEEVLLENYDQFLFKKGEQLPTLNDDNKSFLDSVAALLNQWNERNLTITGFYTEGEKNSPLSNTFQENLGLARAEAIRKLLIARGVSQKRISLDHQLVNNNKLIEHIQFTLYPAGVDEENPEEYAKTQFTFHDMTYSDANFAVDSDVFNPGPAFKLYADSVVNYLQTRNDARLTIIGHTDNSGNHGYNDLLGLKRAKSARRYFKNKGVTTTIKTESRGERQPVAPNDTDANKQKNRRVNFLINN